MTLWRELRIRRLGVRVPPSALRARCIGQGPQRFRPVDCSVSPPSRATTSSRGRRWCVPPAAAFPAVGGPLGAGRPSLPDGPRPAPYKRHADARQRRPAEGRRRTAGTRGRHVVHQPLQPRHANDPARGGKSTWCRAVRRRGWERARRPAAAEALGPLMWLPSQIAAWSRPAARRSPVGGPWWHPDIERRPPGVAALPLEPNTACHAVVRPGGDGEVVVVDDSLNEH